MADPQEVKAAPVTAPAPDPLPAAKAVKAMTGQDIAQRQSFAGYPKTLYHPIQGAVSIADPNEEAALFPRHDYFDTAGEADLHRTDAEAQEVIHQNLAVKVAARNAGQPIDLSDPAQRGEAGVVRNSVQATEHLKRTGSEPL